MGKRKERRLAALSNAGRRVKLDLFAEPSGDLGGSSVNGDIGGGDKHTGLPTSPSSSGQQQNPLMLLGQYSDDELDEQSDGKLDHVAAKNSPSHHIDQEEPSSERKEEDANTIGDAAPKAEQQSMKRDSPLADHSPNVEGGEFEESDSAASTDKCKEVDSTKNASVGETLDAQLVGDLGSGWRMVMHEESNQYYYWNTETGETSWEVPDALAQTTLSISDQRVPLTGNIEAEVINNNESSISDLNASSATLTVAGSVGVSLLHHSQKVPVNGSSADKGVEGCERESFKDSSVEYQTELQINQCAETFVLDDGGDSHNNEVQKEKDLSTNLIRQCECLKERLKSLEGYGNRLLCQDWISKYILEVDIRLSDIKSLSSHGSSLFPFWVYTQRQLQQLEDVINNEIYHLAVSAQMDDDDVGETIDASLEEKETSQGNLDHISKTNICENSGKSEFAQGSISVGNDSPNDPHKNIYTGNISSLEPHDGHLEGCTLDSEKENASVLPEPVFHPAEDVDMEVEDGVSGSITVLGDISSNEGVTPAKEWSQPNTVADFSTMALGEESTVPLPPEEDWIPPPPPDNDQVPPPPPDIDQVPPPPPDVPPESLYPPIPPYTEPSQALPYPHQYNLSYPDSNFQYHAHNVTIPSSNFYGHVDGSQVGVPHPSLYYEAVSHAETAPVIVSYVNQVAYYNLQDGSIPSMPVVSGVGSSLQTDPGPVNYDIFTSDKVQATSVSDNVGAIVDAAKTVPNLKFDVKGVSGTVMASSGVASTSVTTETLETFNGKEEISAPSTNAVTATAAAPATTAAAKTQPKVTRKKRAVTAVPSLRSNKKVSSLVDKWKAAKEELIEDEENEPENAYEILERKRHREIEEWHAKQIASGEAKANANFQPLGGDWRERVKRRRAQAGAAKEASQAPPEAPVEENKQPDLAELSKGLPSGWQAYWDEASKQVYYGNSITSETTWSKPTR